MLYDRPAIKRTIIRKIGSNRCQLCGEPSSVLDLHEIINRNRLGSRSRLEELPIELHAIICRRCNINEKRIKADSKQGRVRLLVANAQLYGLNRMVEILQPYKNLIEFEYEEFVNDDVFKNCDTPNTESFI